MSRVQFARTRDEITAGSLEEAWLEVISKPLVPTRLPAHIERVRTERDTSITLVWSRGQLVALAVRCRDDANYTCLTLVEIGARASWARTGRERE